jgi:hypothetical protein
MKIEKPSSGEGADKSEDRRSSAGRETGRHVGSTAVAGFE